MSGMRVCLASLVLTLVGLSALPGQTVPVAESAAVNAPGNEQPTEAPVMMEGVIAESAAPMPPGQPLTEQQVPAATTVPEGQEQRNTTLPPELSNLAVPRSTSSEPEVVNGPSGKPPTPIFMAPPPLLPLNNWLAYLTTPGCCCFQGKCGPIRSELFLRNGLAFVVGSSIFGKILKTGWDIDGGGRVLFFNPEESRAWTVSIGLSNIYNQARQNPQTYPLTNVRVRTGAINPLTGLATPEEVVTPHVNVTVSGYYQTFANAAFGREIYLCGSANPSQNCLMWRFGYDLGGRWGTARVDLNQIRHLTDTVGGIFGSIHSDLEYPWHCCILQAGLRLEYNYIWDDVLQQQNPSDYQSVNLLFSGGIRF